MRPVHCQQSSGIIETYEPWMHRAKGMPESPLKVLSRFLYHQRWVFTLHPKGLGSTATPKTVSKILRYLTKYVLNCVVETVENVEFLCFLQVLFTVQYKKYNQHVSIHSNTLVLGYARWKDIDLYPAIVE